MSRGLVSNPLLLAPDPMEMLTGRCCCQACERVDFPDPTTPARTMSSCGPCCVIEGPACIVRLYEV